MEGRGKLGMYVVAVAEVLNGRSKLFVAVFSGWRSVEDWCSFRNC